jgi:holo-[acyl-carrier protein] synthase
LIPGEADLLRTGVDIIEVSRIRQSIERHGERFLERIFTADERTYCGNRCPSLAARFAAKEAVAKALGTGIGYVAFREIEIVNDPQGRPEVVLHGSAAELARSLGLVTWAVSLSHTTDHAVASVVAMG